MTLSSPRVMIRDMTLNHTRIRTGRTATIKKRCFVDPSRCEVWGTWTGFRGKEPDPMSSPNVIPVRHLLDSFDTRSPSAL